MKLSELAIAVYLYDCFTGYDKSYFQFVNQIGNTCTLDKSAVRNALIKWLNKWGCRQFALKHHSLASSELLKWYRKFSESLPCMDANLWELTDGDLDQRTDMFNGLAAARASIRWHRTVMFGVKVGRTGAAKILFALRPKVFPPWDEPIRR